MKTILNIILLMFITTVASAQYPWKINLEPSLDKTVEHVLISQTNANSDVTSKKYARNGQYRSIPKSEFLEGVGGTDTYLGGMNLDALSSTTFRGHDNGLTFDSVSYFRVNSAISSYTTGTKTFFNLQPDQLSLTNNIPDFGNYEFSFLVGGGGASFSSSDDNPPSFSMNMIPSEWQVFVGAGSDENYARVDASQILLYSGQNFGDEAKVELTLDGDVILTTNGGNINVSGTQLFADDAAAGVGGLTTGDLYHTATGVLMIKL